MYIMHFNNNMCNVCCNNLKVFNEIIYHKKLKEDCEVCCNNGLDNMYYCYCENSNDNYMTFNKKISCNICDKYSLVKNNNNIITDDLKIKNLYSLSYKQLYSIAKYNKIKNRSSMTKYDLINCIYFNF